MALRRNFSSFRGEDIRLRVTLDPVPTGGISGYTFAFTARTDGSAASASLEKDNSTFTIEDATNGIFYVNIADTDTTGLTVRTYDYDIKRTNSGSEAILVYGEWDLMQDVTR